MNITTISGRLGKDIEIRVDEKKMIEGEISIAVNDYIGKSAQGEPKYWLTWVTCVIRGERVMALQDQLCKGRFVCISGQLRTRNWKTSDGKTVPVSYVLVDNIEFDSK